jgi:hypothetical protein
MSRKFNPVSAILAFTFLFLAASSAMAQSERPNLEAVSIGAQRGPTLGCCKCLGGTNTLDLSTISSNKWTVNGSPAVFLTALHPLWNINPGPAKWVSTLATGSTGGIPGGAYDYRLDFVVPACTIDQTVTLTGNFGGDDDVQVFLDNNGLVPACTGGWCFNTPKKTLPTFSANVGSGSHSLIVKVKNSSTGPSGMFINAKLTANCTSEPIRPRRDER